MKKPLSEKIGYVEDYQIVPEEQTHIATRCKILEVEDVAEAVQELKKELIDYQTDIIDLIQISNFGEKYGEEDLIIKMQRLGLAHKQEIDKIFGKFENQSQERKSIAPTETPDTLRGSTDEEILKEVYLDILNNCERCKEVGLCKVHTESYYASEKAITLTRQKGAKE